MTLVINDPADGPRIHLLAIGVGSYRHLPGGAEEVRHDTLGLRQLTGPPHSTLAFVDFVRSRLQHPTAQIGTVELLLSPAQEWKREGRSMVVEAPTMANVVRAAEAWYERCDHDPDGVGLLYFCGHGVQRESPFLLLEDFGRSELNLLENAVDILPTFYGLAACSIRTQYAFVDACREVPHQLLASLTGRPRVLFTKPVFGEDRDGAVLFATSGGHRAYGLPEQPTRFTEMLIKAWEGLGSRQVGARWMVDFGGLQNAITALLRREDPRAPRQQPQAFWVSGTAVLHVRSEPPLVPLRVTCLPPEAMRTSGVTASLLPVGSTTTMALTASTSGWEAELPADLYQLDIDAQPPYRRPTSERIAAWPPYCDHEVTVAP